MCPLLLCLGVLGCAGVPHARRGVGSLQIRGMHQLDERALAVCLATRERGTLAIDISTNPSPACNKPPFDAGHIRWSLFSWPWEQYPIYDRVVFERDVERVTRWYRAHGFYDATVLSSQVTPPTDPTGGGEAAVITVDVQEGPPVRVKDISVTGTSDLPRDLRAQVEAAMVLRPRDRFDEVLYDQGKQTIARELREASYARANVRGTVTIDRQLHEAHIVYTVEHGPACHFGDLAIYVDDPGVPGGPIVAAARIDRDQPFSQSAVDDAERAIYALGAFSSVEVQPDVDSDAQDLSEIDVKITAHTGALQRRGVGLGVQIGSVAQLNSNYQVTETVPQWDVHILGIFEDRNFLSGLRHLRLELRPRLIFANAFPGVTTPYPGLIVSADLRQPGFFEARTNLHVNARYDIGPDPFGRQFFRQTFDTSVGPERTFFKGKLYTAIGLHLLLSVPSELPGATVLSDPADPMSPRVQAPVPEDQSQYLIGFVEQTVRLDLRNDPANPREGFFAQVTAQESPFESGWQFVRVTPDVRAYLPLPLGIVIAARFAVGIQAVLWHDPALPETLMRTANETGAPAQGLLGPDAYRLRGGGANSDRGYLPGQLGGPTLGTFSSADQAVRLDRSDAAHATIADRLIANDSLRGGLRRWEASLEIRVPLSPEFGLVFFADMGDVSPTTDFRFYALALSVGFGIRYRTIVGPIRLDLGIRVPGVQCLEQAANCPAPPLDQNLLVAIPGALHITIGESF